MQNSNIPAAPRCQHIKANGHLCASPALRGQPFCYNHDRAHHPPAHPRKNPAAFIPLLENGQAMVIAITNISRAVCSGELDASQANTLFKGLRLLKTAFEFRFSLGDGPEAQALTEGMADVLARAYAPPVAEEIAEATTAPEPVILNEDACPSEGPHQPAPHPERSGISTTTPTSPLGEVKPLRAQRASVGNRTEINSPSPVGATPSSEDTSTNKIYPSPIANLPLDAPLTDRQLDYCRFVLRYGPTHPEYDDCSKRLEPDTPTRATA